MIPIKVISFWFLGLIVLLSCTRKENEVVWDKNFPVIGSQSSLRAADLNEDGVLDIVIGAGKNEYQYSDKGILALDGKTGDILWQQETTDQVFGSATFYDITGDGVEDIFIGGRSPNFKALNGKTGDVLWAYDYKQNKNDSVLQYARFNFYNSVLVPDQNNDGFPELLTVNGGNSKAPANSEKDRYPGVIILFDIKTGEIIGADTTPDRKESYMSPVCLPHSDPDSCSIIFGSGGERFPGNLYIAKISDLINRKLTSNAKVIASEKGHGFIAPPALADITNDGVHDIVAISHGSTAYAIDGKDHKLLWKQNIEGTESSNSFAVGYFNHDDIPDFFTFVSKGVWPNSTGSVQVMLDGKTGQIAYMDSMGCTGFSSPVVYDLNNDGRDEAIISINEYDCERGYTDNSKLTIKTKLLAIDFDRHSTNIIDQLPQFKNIFTTPWIGDMDQDGYLDIVHCQYFSASPNLIAFLGMRIKRISTSVRVREAPVWGAYMGSNGDGIFPLGEDK